MLWQDMIFAAGSLLTVVVLVPAARDASTQIPIATSLPKVALGVVYAVTFATLGMYLAATGLLATGIMWYLIAAYRSPRGVLGRYRSRRAPTARVDRDRMRRLDD